MGTDFNVCIERQFDGIEGTVLNQKFTTSHRVCRGIVPAEGFDGSKDVIGGLGPWERLGIGVVSVDERSDVCPEGGDAAIDAAPDLLIGEKREEVLDPVEP